MGHQSSEGHLRYGGQGAEQPMQGDDTVVIRAHKVGGRGPFKVHGVSGQPGFLENDEGILLFLPSSVPRN